MSEELRPGTGEAGAAQPGAGVPPAGPADELVDAARAEAATLEGELEVLQAALARLEEGSYGRCEICGAALDDALLEADPAAARCPAHASS